MKFRLLLITLMVVFMLTDSPAQEAEKFVPGEMIVQLAKTVSMEEFTSMDMPMEIIPVRCLSPRMNIWLISFRGEGGDDYRTLEDMRKQRGVLAAQFNHYIEMRETIPDDPQFEDQWALKNTQQSGGVEDADIDATDAWDITTGGLTATGDTIVIAIVDDGFDLTHEDINFWKNYHEIPDNGIDDDGNGYIDDYDGWNSRYSNGNITSQDHGTHVTGIAGAIGNNGKGVSGVNWGARILPVLGSSTLEAPVVEAYGYIYEIRSTYDETNGAEGAFVVSTNASFGVNMGQPANFPIWGSMYDSLGRLGVLSAGATANANWNIDEVGDIPTAFPSEFLITVTNTTQHDKKNSSAGYGLETIDLGAPGTGVMSTRWFNNYGMKTGTSMSSPHVAGAVALLMAAGSEGFINAYKVNPEELSLLVRDYILEGVDTLSDLNGKTATGGRLNVYNSVIHMAEPSLGVNPDNFNVSMMQNSQDSSTFGIRNTDIVAMDYEVDVAALPLWLTVDPVSGSLFPNETDSLKIFYDPSGINPGQYNTNIRITSLKGEEYFVLVELQVLPVSVIEEEHNPSAVLSCFPVPFSETLSIEVYNPDENYIMIGMYDLKGKLVKTLVDERKMKGTSRFEWDGRDETGHVMPDGIYFCHMIHGDQLLSRKVILNR